MYVNAEDWGLCLDVMDDDENSNANARQLEHERLELKWMQLFGFSWILTGVDFMQLSLLKANK